MTDLRLHFSKTFGARYISHLDLMRTMTRTIRASGLEVWYTEGFNAHLYLTFALPLSLGFESLCETCDVRLLGGGADFTEVAARINRGLPFGLEVFNCGEAKHKPGEIAFARYICELADARRTPAELVDGAKSVLERPEIPAEKRTKKGGLRTLDLKPLICASSVYAKGENCYLDLTLSASSENALNPMLLLGQVFAQLGGETDHLLVKRTQILTREMENFE